MRRCRGRRTKVRRERLSSYVKGLVRKFGDLVAVDVMVIGIFGAVMITVAVWMFSLQD